MLQIVLSMGRFFSMLLWSIGHYSKKLHCNRLMRKMCKPFVIVKKVHEVRPLEEFRPDCGESCLCENYLNPDSAFDLQIVVPCYNVGEYVVECIDSILSQQTRFKFKIVIVNDGSTDCTAEKLSRYEGLDNVEILHQKNRGLSGARNTGMQNLDAKYVLFVDSDDVLCPGAVEALMSKAVSLDADIVDGGFERFCGEKSLSVNVPPDSDDNRWISGFAWGKVYKASLWQNVHFPERYWFEDTVIYHVVLPMARTVASVSDVVYRWRKNEKSITASYVKNYKSVDAFWVTNRMMDDREVLGLSVDQMYLTVFLSQVRGNFQRCARLYDEELNQSMFVATRELYLKHIAGSFVLENDKLESALREDDYGLYKLCCLFE